MSVEKTTPASPPQQSAQTLLLPASAYTPATLSISRSITEQDIEGPSAGYPWFRSFHSSGTAGNYSTFGLVFAAYQRADWNASSPSAEFRYQGSYMNSVSGASNAWQDGVTYMLQQNPGAQNGVCTKNTSVLQCQYVDTTWQDTSGVNWSEEYVAMQFNKCLVEISGDVPSSYAGSLSSQFETTMNNIYQAAGTAMDNTCGSGGNPTPVTQPTQRPTTAPPPTVTPSQTDFNVVSVRFEKNNAKADWNLQSAPLTQIKTGTAVQASIYFSVRSLAHSSAAVTREYTIRRGGQVVFHEVSNGGDPITDADTYRYTWTGIKKELSKPGQYTFTGKITIDGKSDSDTAPLTVTKKPVAVKKVSFQLNSVSLLNDNSVPQQRFHPGDGFNVQISFTVKNAKSPVPFTARIVFVNPSTNHALTKPVPEHPTASNGTQSPSYHFLTPRSFGSQVKIQVSLTGGSVTKTGSTMLLVS